MNALDGKWRMRQFLIGAGVAALLAACSGERSDTAKAAVAGETSEIHFNGPLGQYRGIVYVPASAKSEQPVPLVVMVHGANTTAEQQREVSQFDPIADREGFIVMYPDHETSSQLGLHPLQAWRFYNPAEMQRGFGDTEALAALTQQVMQDHNVDPERVYMIGSSAGGWMASIMGATYPDVYAAIGVADGGGYGIGLAGFSQPYGAALVPPEGTAAAAYAAMGTYARVMPVINFQGSEDEAVPPSTGQHLVQQWLMTNNLVVSGSLNAPFPLLPTETVTGSPHPGGHPYEVDIYRDAEGCRILEQVRIEGMAHFWPGGTSDPAYDGYTDTRAPNAAEMTWAFFKRFRRSGTAPPCIEAGP